jgi:glycosyltransferase involved in cell wall biosynthesis/putative flippase GtrA
VSASWLIATVSRYGVVGALCALLNVAIIAVVTQGLRLPYPIAAGCTCIITIPLSYLLHRRVSFEVAGLASWREFRRFVAAQLSQFALGFVLMAAIIEGLGWQPWVAMAWVSVALAAYGFITSSAWVFGVWKRRGADAAQPPVGGPLRVLTISAFFPAHGGGIEVVAGQLATRFARAGVRVHWMAGGPNSELPGEATPGLVIDRAASLDFVEHSIGLPAPVWGPASLRRLWQRVGTSDIVHVHDYLYLSSLAAVLFARLRRRPVVLTQHIGDIAFDARLPRLALRLLNGTLGRWVLGRADQVVFVGRPIMSYFGRFVRYRRAPLLIPNGVDHAVYHPDASGPRAARLSDPASPVVPADVPLKALFVGRFVEKKGLVHLRRCMSLPDIHWTFVGRGPVSPAEWNIPASRLQLRGMLAPSDVADAMRAADLLVLPSKGEGFPLVIQEALSCGTPVLVSQEIADAFPQIDPRCVWSVDLRPSAGEEGADVAGRLRAEIARLAGAREVLHSARPLAAALAAQWSWETCVDSYMKVYQDIRH